MISFSIRLKEALKSKGMTQMELAEKADTTAATISRYLSDNRTPNIILLNNIASALNVTADYLLGNTDDPTPPSLAKDLKYSDLDASFYEGVDLLTDSEKDIILSHMKFLINEREKNKEK
jgi:transcriptional regulator with XRE-family HTH domain